MNKKTMAIAVAVAMMITQTGIAASAATNAKVQAKTQVKPVVATISTSAQAILEVAPDVAYVNASVSTVDESKTVSIANNKKSTAAVIDAIMAAGVSKADIKTISFTCYSFYDSVIVDTQATNPIYKSVKKYQSTATYKITVSNLNLVGDVLASASEINDVEISGVTYAVKDVEKYKSKVIAQAVRMAKANAVYSAEAAGLQIAKVKSMQVDFSTPSPIPYYYREAKMADTASSVYQNPLSINIVASVSMVFETK